MSYVNSTMRCFAAQAEPGFMPQADARAKGVLLHTKFPTQHAE